MTVGLFHANVLVAVQTKHHVFPGSLGHVLIGDLFFDIVLFVYYAVLVADLGVLWEFVDD